MTPGEDTAFQREGAASFLTTAWSVVREAQDPAGELYRRSVEELCSTYWKPVYAFIRGRGWNAEEARDLTQEYFSRFLEKELVRRADRSKGRFRSFVLVTVERFLRDELDKRERRRRAHERMAEERARSDAAACASDPEEEFNRELASEILSRVLDRMRVQCAERGQERYHAAFCARVEGEAEGSAPSYEELASRLGMSVTDVTNAIHRGRAIFRMLLREEIRKGVATEAEVDAEIADLRRYLS